MKSIIFTVPRIMQGVYTLEIDLGSPLRALPMPGIIITLCRIIVRIEIN